MKKISKPKPMARGFALVELSIVIALLIIIAMLTLQSFSFYNRLFLHAEIDRLYTLLVATSRRAAIDHQPHEISFDETGTYKYAAHQSSKNYTKEKLAQGVMFGLLPGIKGPPAQPKDLVKKPITFEKQRITFAADGKAQAGTLYITDTKKQWQYAISAPVGTISYLRRYRYHHNRWELIP